MLPCIARCIVFFETMVTFFSYISNACYTLLGVTERLQHTCIMHPENRRRAAYLIKRRNAVNMTRPTLSELLTPLVGAL